MLLIYVRFLVPKNHPIEKENHLNQTSIVGFHVNFCLVTFFGFSESFSLSQKGRDGTCRAHGRYVRGTQQHVEDGKKTSRGKSNMKIECVYTMCISIWYMYVFTIICICKCTRRQVQWKIKWKSSQFQGRRRRKDPVAVFCLRGYTKFGE